MVNGKEVRRKVGRKTDAKAFHMRTKAQILEGRLNRNRLAFSPWGHGSVRI